MISLTIRLFETLGNTPCNQTVKDELLIGSMGGKRDSNFVTTYDLRGCVFELCTLWEVFYNFGWPVDEFPEVTFEY